MSETTVLRGGQIQMIRSAARQHGVDEGALVARVRTKVQVVSGRRYGPDDFKQVTNGQLQTAISLALADVPAEPA